MSRSVNKVLLLGHLGKEIEVKFTPNGTQVGRFSIATSRRWKDKPSGEWKEETDWHNCVLWRCDNLSNYLTKGKQVLVEGRLQTRSWEKDGQKHYTTEVVCDDVILLGGVPGEQRSGPRVSNGVAKDDPMGVSDEDVPF